MVAWFRTAYPRPEDRWRFVIWAVLAVVVVVSAVRYWEKTNKVADDNQFTKSAFLRWRPQVLALDAGTDIYEKFNYPNPPVMALVLRPFFRLDRQAGAMAWFAAKVAMAGCVWVWARRLAAEPGRPPVPLGPLAAAGAISLHPVLGDLSHGNVNIFIAFLVAGALELVRRRRDGLAGLVLGLAIACKLTPALFLPYFVWKRMWGLTAATLLGCAVWFLAAPAAVFAADRGGLAAGWEFNTELLQSWYETMAKPFIEDGVVNGEHANQSLPGLTARLLTNVPSDTTDYDDAGRGVGFTYHTVTDIGKPAARWLMRGYQLAFAALTVWLCRAALVGPGSARQGVRVAAEFGFVCLGMLLLSERTWKHHGVVTIIPLVAIAAFLGTRRLSAVVRAGVVAANTAVILLIVIPSAVGDVTQDTALAYGSHTLVFLTLTAEVLFVLWREGRPPVESPPPPPPAAAP